MKAALVFPPQGHFTAPYLSVPSLAAYLRRAGVDTTVIDANIDSYDHFLSRERLERSLERVRAGEGLASLEAKENLRFSDMERHQLLSEIDLIGPEVARSIEKAKHILRTKELFYDYERYLWAGRTIEQALRLFSAEYAPSRLTAHGFVMRHRLERSADILAAVEDEAENPYAEFFRTHVMPGLTETDPDLVGISVTFGAQAVPALTLARQIKAWKPECHVTLGGGLLAYTAQKLARRDEIWELIDSFVMLEGERPLLGICEAIDAGRGIGDVPNLIYRSPGGEVRETPQAEPLDIKTLPTPDFDGLPLEKYLSPELVLPLACTRGCYWGKCVFCTLYTVIGPGYRGRGLDQTVDDIRVLSNKYDTRNFYLAIEDLPPNMAKAMPRKIIDAGLDINWWCDARLEHDVFTQDVCDDLAASGCKRIAFGYESSSKRVLDRMCKGIDPEASLDLIRRVRHSGISVTLYAMVGFPTETREEAEQTLQTILDNRDHIQEVSVRVFYLDETSEIFKRREEFDIVEVYPDPEADLQVYYDFKAGSGMSRREARQMYLKFTDALRSHFPVFQNTNMLYHELKGHYFLYLVHHGSWEQLRENVLDRSANRDVSVAARPGVLGPLLRRSLRFDRAEIDRVLGSIDSHTLRPRYQSDLIEEDDRKHLDQVTPPLDPSPSELVYDSASGEVHCLTPAAAELLDRCNGEREVERVIENVPEPYREDAARCLSELAGASLIERETRVGEVIS